VATDLAPSSSAGDALAEIARRLVASVPGSSTGVFDDVRVAASRLLIPPLANVHVGVIIPIATRILQPERGQLEYLGTYLTLEEWLTPGIRARGIEVPVGFWVEHLLSQQSRDEMLAALARLARIAQPDRQADLINTVRATCTDDLLRPLDDALAKFARRPFVCRQGILLAAKAVLRRDAPPNPGSGIPPLLAAALLCQAILDDVARAEIQPTGAELYPGMDEGLAIETYRNSLFQATSEAVTTLDLTRRLWLNHLPRGDAAMPKSPADLFAEATGIDLPTFVELGFMMWATVANTPPDRAPILHHWSDYPFDQDFLEGALTFVGATPDELVAAMDSSRAGGGLWDVLAFEEHPIVLLPKRPPLVLDEVLLWRRCADGPFYAVLDHLRDTEGVKASRAWTKAYGNMVEQAANATLPQLALPLPPSDHAYWDGEAVKAAFGGGDRKTADGALLYGSDAVVTEVVSSGPTVLSRVLGASEGFATVMERQVWDKLEQLDSTANDMLDDDRRLTGWPNQVTGSVRPLLVQGRAFAFMPVMRAYIDAQCATRGLLQRERIKPLLIVELDELEMLLAVAQATSKTLTQLLDEWDAGPRRMWPVKNHLLAAYGNLEARLRPASVTDGILATFAELERRARPQGTAPELGTTAPAQQPDSPLAPL
jgi:hypothetical protein